MNTAERRAFFAAIRREPDKLRRAFCLTLYYTGCRISEALSVTAQRVDLSQKSIVFETLKQQRRGVFRAVPIPDSLVRMLGKLVAGAARSGRVWTFSRATAYRLIKGRMRQMHIAGAMASPKGLRHGFAVACIAKKVPLTTVKKWMGHARLETTAIYLDVSGEEERKLARRTWGRQ